MIQASWCRTLKSDMDVAGYRWEMAKAGTRDHPGGERRRQLGRVTVRAEAPHAPFPGGAEGQAGPTQSRLAWAAGLVWLDSGTRVLWVGVPEKAGYRGGQYDLKGKLPEWKCDRKPFGFWGTSELTQEWDGSPGIKVKDHGRLSEGVEGGHQKS